MSTQQTVRRWIMTGSVASIVFVGTYYGATLKTDFDVNKKRKEVRTVPPEEIIAQLEASREQLVFKKSELERKIDRFRTRRKAEELEIQQDSKGK